MEGKTVSQLCKKKLFQFMMNGAEIILNRRPAEDL
jgi:hypothetical protein